MDCWCGRVSARTIPEIPECKVSISHASSVLPCKVAFRRWRAMALATMADSQRIRTVRSGADRYCTLLMPLLLLLFRPGLPGCLTAILPGAHNKTVTVWQQPRIGPQLSSIRSQAHPTKGWSASLKGGFASGRTTGGGNDGGVVAASSPYEGCSRLAANPLPRRTKAGPGS